MRAELSRLSINQATTRQQWTLQEAIEGYARAGIRGIGVWPEKLAELGSNNAVRLISANELSVTSYCRGGVFSARNRQDLEHQIDELKRDLDTAAELSADCFVVVAGTLSGNFETLSEARHWFTDGLARLAEHAAIVDVPVAVEPIHPMRAGDLCCVNTLAQALDISDALDATTGIVIDTYHVWWDPELEEQIRRAKGRIRALQLSDWLASTRSLVDDRGMIGDGVIDLKAIREAVEATGYQGYCEIEIMSARDWWKRDPAEVIECCKERFLECC